MSLYGEYIDAVTIQHQPEESIPVDYAELPE